MLRVVSLIASSTEMVCALGCRENLVGRSHECDYPASVVELPVCTEPKFNIAGTSYEIDQRVKAIVQEGLSVYRVHAKQLDALRPDLILTQTQCEVCAVSLRDVQEAVCELVASRPRVVSLNPNALADIWADLRSVALALGVAARGELLVAELWAEMQKIARSAGALGTRPRVAYIEWIEPLMAGGNWMPELVGLAGGVNLFGVGGKHSPFMAWEEVVAADPDILFVAPCGFDIARTRSEMHCLSGRPEWTRLKAVKEGRVYLADGNQFFNRPGPRVLEALEILVEVFFPRVFQFGFEGSGWERYQVG